jgi:hypothetical protein
VASAVPSARGRVLAPAITGHAVAPSAARNSRHRIVAPSQGNLGSRRSRRLLHRMRQVLAQRGSHGRRRPRRLSGVKPSWAVAPHGIRQFAIRKVPPSGPGLGEVREPRIDIEKNAYR